MSYFKVYNKEVFLFLDGLHAADLVRLNYDCVFVQVPQSQSESLLLLIFAAYVQRKSNLLVCGAYSVSLKGFH